MGQEIVQRIENIFRSSVSSDELFDAFRDAIANRLNNADLYKILIANAHLTHDEVKMYTEKLLKEFPENGFDLCMWTAKVFENCMPELECLEHSIYYYSKAIVNEPTNFLPFIKLLHLYNTEIRLPHNKKILEIIDTGIPAVHLKSKIYYALSTLYKRLGNPNNESHYINLAEKAAEREGD